NRSLNGVVKERVLDLDGGAIQQTLNRPRAPENHRDDEQEIRRPAVKDFASPRRGRVEEISEASPSGYADSRDWRLHGETKRGLRLPDAQAKNQRRHRDNRAEDVREVRTHEVRDQKLTKRKRHAGYDQSRPYAQRALGPSQDDDEIGGDDHGDQRTNAAGCGAQRLKRKAGDGGQRHDGQAQRA